jgi:hypothetical protein
LAKIGFARNPPSFNIETKNPRMVELAWLKHDKERRKEKIKKYEGKLSKIEDMKKWRYRLVKGYYKSRIESLKELDKLSSN